VRSGSVYSVTYPTATKVKLRFDITDVNPITPSDIFTAGVSIDYLIPLQELKQNIDDATEILSSVTYKQFVVSNNTTSLVPYTDIGIYRCKSSVAENIVDAPESGPFDLIVLDTFGGGHAQQIFISQTQKIYTRVIDRSNGTVYSNWARKDADASAHSILYGKKWVACGDSFTHGDFEGDSTDYQFQDEPYQGENMTYPFWIGRRTGCNVINEAVNGTSMGYKSGVSTANNCFSYENGRYTQIPSDADYITLYFGINDGENHKNIPIGTINDNTNETFYGAWNIVMTHLITNHPNAKIGIIISNACDSIDYPNAEIAIAKKYGVAYFDMNGDPKIPIFFRTNGKNEYLSSAIKNLRSQQYFVSSTNGHPNVACHKDESTCIQAWLESI
jgi:hypothetical protein